MGKNRVQVTLRVPSGKPQEHIITFDMECAPGTTFRKGENILLHESLPCGIPYLRGANGPKSIILSTTQSNLRLIMRILKNDSGISNVKLQEAR